MTHVAALFPGQGFERPGMARELLGHALFEVASRACGVDVRRALERWSPELSRTAVLQPTLVAASLAAFEPFATTPVDFVAGHSIGEIAAWAAAGGIDPEDAVRLAARRGAAMEREAARYPGAMVSVDRSLLPRRGALEIAATSSPRHAVLCGDEAAVRDLEQLGGTRLPVGGAWHGRAMAGARSDLAQALASIPTTRTTRRLVTCLDGSVVDAPDLVRQLTAPVAWDAVMATLLRHGVTTVLTVGPGKVMRGLVRENAPTLVVLATEPPGAALASMASLETAS